MSEVCTTLDSVYQALQDWRANKSSSTNKGIPDEIWKAVFNLENKGHKAGSLKAMFQLNSQQYRKKHVQLVPEHKTSSPPPTEPPAQFAEALIDDASAPADVPPLTQVAAKNTKQTIKTLKSTRQTLEDFLDSTTVIVECIRPDGHRLKIHTTHQKLHTVMQSFFAKAAQPC